MKTSIKAFLSIIAFGAAAVFVQAQPALKVVTIDINKALQGYYKTAEEQTKIAAYEQEANTRMQTMISEGRAMADKIKEAQDILNNPISADTAKKKAQEEGQRILAQVQEQEQKINQYRQQAVQYIQQGLMTKRNELVTEISNIATTIGKNKGATLIVERNAFVYGDTAYDITDDVIKELNKNKPAGVSVGLPK